MTGARTRTALPAPRIRFTLPPERTATAPPESRGVPRDQVRLLVADGTRIHHSRFSDLGRFLRPGDLLVVNTSATVPAAADGVRDITGDPVVVHFSATLDTGERVVELRTAPDAAAPVLDAMAAERIRLANHTLTLIAPYPTENRRLWRAAASPGIDEHLAKVGRPIRYGYVPSPWPLEAYQTVFGIHPGSAEMPSAARAFTPELVTRLTAQGVLFAPVTLHTGVSSLEPGEPPYPERFSVPSVTAHLVSWVRDQRHRVIAVGTTVARALESAVHSDGRVWPADGWTDLVLAPDSPPQVLDGLLTGLHPPDASHLSMLEAIVGPSMVDRVYRQALRHEYLWHEFGDLTLLLR